MLIKANLYALKKERNMSDYITNSYRNSYRTQNIDKIDDYKLNSSQLNYLKKVYEGLIQDGYFITSEGKKGFEKAIVDIKHFYPKEEDFRKRITIYLKLYKAKNERHRRINGERYPTPAMYCMYKGCQEDRSRPYVHHIKFWDPTSDEFYHLWPTLKSFLKKGYHNELWRERSNYYGIYLCCSHSSQILMRFNQYRPDISLKYKNYYILARKLIFLKIIIDNPFYFSIVVNMLN